MKSIEWEKKFETDIVIIDNQHKNLVLILNELIELEEENNKIDLIRQTIYRLVEYTKTHFTTEEKHMFDNKYADLEFHKKEHKKMIEEVVQIIGKVNQNDIEEVYNDILVFLESWLIEHILGHDKKYSDYYHNICLD